MCWDRWFKVLSLPSSFCFLRREFANIFPSNCCRTQCVCQTPVTVSFQVDRVSYLLQEIYGIENKNNQETKVCLLHAVLWCFTEACSSFDYFFLSSHQMMKTVTTATSVLCVCLTCGTRSSCPADICVSATPAQTHCVTRPTTVRSAGCVRAVIFMKFAPFRFFPNAT